jgi:hypothetical protein
MDFTDRRLWYGVVAVIVVIASDWVCGWVVWRNTPTSASEVSELVVTTGGGGP